jgi:hypothetical protein
MTILMLLSRHSMNRPGIPAAAQDTDRNGRTRGTGSGNGVVSAIQ